MTDARQQQTCDGVLFGVKDKNDSARNKYLPRLQ